jgi:hypothetical protein
MITENDFFILVFIAMVISPLIAALWSITIEWYLFDRSQRKEVEKQYEEWSINS